jgi:hypothetical protein
VFKDIERRNSNPDLKSPMMQPILPISSWHPLS